MTLAASLLGDLGLFPYIHAKGAKKYRHLCLFQRFCKDVPKSQMVVLAQITPLRFFLPSLCGGDCGLSLNTHSFQESRIVMGYQVPWKKAKFPVFLAAKYNT